MELRILGPVEVAAADGQPLALGGHQRRLLLAVLLSRAGQVCSTGMLAEALWGDEPPPAFITVLHAHMSRLRKLLEPDRAPRSPPQVLLSVDDGYRIDVGDHGFDAERFTGLVDDGLTASRAGDRDTGPTYLAEALGLWRGPAFGDLGSHPMLVVAAAELDERRALAREKLIDARLQLGQHAELVAELQAIVDEYPYRERLWAQLMLALYRSGRQADALAAYKRCRRRLIDELGIEPGSDLQTLEEAVLLQKSELDWEPARAPLATPPLDRPRRPPAPRTTFVGRDTESKEVNDALEIHRLVTITGPGGVGKTRLSIEVAGAIDDRFRHGAAFCDLATTPTGDLLEATVAEAVGMRQPAGRGDQPLVEQIVDHLAGRELLLVIDNADRFIGPVAALAEVLLDRCARLWIVVTSREPARVIGERLVRLSPLPIDDHDAAAVNLFVDRAAMASPHARLDRDAVARLCRRLDGLPLAIELAASRLRSTPFDHLVPDREVGQSVAEIAASPAAPRSRVTLRGVVDWSIDALTADRQELLRRLAVFAGGCSAGAAAAVCLPQRDPVAALADLVDRSLLQLDDAAGVARYRMLEAIRADGLERLADAGELDRVCAQHLAWCLSLAPADLAHGEDPTVVAGLGDEIDNVVAALAWGLAGGDIAAGTSLASAAACYWVHAGRFREARAWLERAVTATPTSSRDHRTALRWLGWVLARQSDLSAARRVLNGAVAAGPSGSEDPGVVIDAEIVLAGVEIEAGDLPVGEARLRRLADEPDVVADPARRALISHGLGRRALLAGDLPLASDLLERAVRESRAAGMWHSLALGLAGVCQVEAGRRHLPRAEGAFAESLAVTRSHQLLGLLPRILGAGAVLAARSGDRELARTRFEETLSAARRSGDLRAEVATLTNLGALDHNDGDALSAVVHLEEALTLANKISDERIALRVLANLAESVIAGSHDSGRALALAAEALRRARPLGLRISEVAAIESAALALIARAQPGDLERAAAFLGAAAAEREALDYVLDAEADSPVERARTQVADTIGHVAADHESAEGRRRGLDAVGDDLLAATSGISGSR